MFDFKEFDSVPAMDKALLADFVKHIYQLLQYKERLNVAIATGTTLLPFLNALRFEKIPFHKIDLYIVDEYAGLKYTDKRSCTYDIYKFLDDRVFDFHSIKMFTPDNYINEIDLYNFELSKTGLDICVLGVGVDGHIGFCYPPAKILPHKYYELTTLSSVRKQEHVANGWFSTIDSVPENIITLTVWGIMQSSIIMIGALYQKKHNVIHHMHTRQISPTYCPVLFLSKHNAVAVYIGKSPKLYTESRESFETNNY